MRRTLGAATLIGASVAAAIAAPLPGTGRTTEVEALTSSQPQADRSAPPHVAPVEHRGIRYEQDLQDAELGGRLAAVDARTGTRLWTLEIYRVVDNEASGVDAIGRYFRSMSLGAEPDTLLIEDEAGSHYAVDLARRSVTALDEPPKARSGAPPKPKPQP